MSLQVAPASIFASNDPSTTQLLDKLFQFVHCHIFTYQLAAHDYIRDDRGVFVDPDLAITLWTSAKLLAEGIHITPDVISYCHDQHFPLPSRLLTYNYARGPNPLLGGIQLPARSNSRGKGMPRGGETGYPMDCFHSSGTDAFTGNALQRT